MLRDLFSLFPAHAGVIPRGNAKSRRERQLFPAHAGVILRFYSPENKEITFPRTCGGDPYTAKPADYIVPFSPHTRG